MRYVHPTNLFLTRYKFAAQPVPINLVYQGEISGKACVVNLVSCLLMPPGPWSGKVI